MAPTKQYGICGRLRVLFLGEYSTVIPRLPCQGFLYVVDCDVDY